MPNSENSETGVPTQRVKLAQTIAKPSTPTQTQTPAPTQTTLPTSKGKLLKIVLVTIAGLAVIAALIIAGFYLNKLQGTKQRDAKRKSDITIIQEGLEKYKQDTLDAQYYPSAITANTLEKRAYLDKFPTDPKNSFSYVYNYQGLPGGCAATGACNGYILTACLENKNDKEKTPTAPIAPCTTRSYQVTNP